MTEQEAMKCWCPMSGKRKANDTHRDTVCISRFCMAWRVVEEEREKLSSWSCKHSEQCKASGNFSYGPDVLDFDECPVCGAEVVRNYITLPSEGYCGLAGIEKG